MKSIMKTEGLLLLVCSLLLLGSCTEPFERSGIVVDRITRQPIEGVSIDIYMKGQRRDSLKEKVFTDKNGYFITKEKRDADESFLFMKKGYIGYTSSLSAKNDTIDMIRE